MDAQTLGALADIVKEAIAQAVAPLHDRIKELEGRPVYDPQPFAEFSSRAVETSGQLREQLDAIAKSIPQPYDDTALVARVAKQLDDFRAELPAPYDDTEIKGALVDVEMRLGAKQSQEIEALLDRLKDARYDDTKLCSDVSKLSESLDTFKKHVQETAKTVRDGANGLDGKDALHLEVLPGIEVGKSYQRGTYAKHAGGLWRSFEQTHGMRGWECIVDGVAAVVPKLEGKSLQLTVVQSSGTEAILHADLPIQEYKGVWSEGDYLKHDTVTWAGSLWHCNKTATTAKPGDGSPDWTLAVKKGRDGREVVSVPKGAPQPVQIGGANG